MLVVTWAIAVPLLAFAAVALGDFAALAGWARLHVGLAVTLAFVIMWLMTLALIPLAAVMGLTGIVGAALFIGFMPALSAASTEAVGFLTNSQVATLPLFLMMGSFAAASDISDDVYRLAHVVLGRFRGGLALATIGGCAGFGSLTGSSLATSAIIGKVALPEMLQRGYSPAFATGCCAAGGTLGALMPPASGPLILFALLSEASIGQLFVAAIVPGLLALALYFMVVALYVRLAPGAAPVSAPSERGELLRSLRRCGFAATLFGSVLGGIYSGVFTATEAAAVGAFEAFLCALLRGKLGGGAFWRVMAETTGTTAMIYGLIFGAQIFSFFVGVSALTEAATAFVQTLHLSPLGVITWILVIYLLLGSLMESFAVMVITVPIVTPLVMGMGYDIAWWGIINLCVVETGLIHPPLGLNVFMLKSMQPDVPMWTIYRGVFPFVAADLVKLALLVVFPSITLWLTTMMGH
jgi:C4-dicarboxylate transporter DctM subunit